MILTTQNAITLLPIVADLIIKISSVMNTGEPLSIEDEINRLDGARLKPSDDIIAQADKDSGNVE